MSDATEVQAPWELVNGCSGLQSWAWRQITGHGPPWEYCCDEHDVAYLEHDLGVSRKVADQRLRDCMIELGYPRWAWIYYAAVRAFGWFWWVT